MSKFFKALEKVEHEREARSGSTAAAEPARAVAEVVPERASPPAAAAPAIAPTPVAPAPAAPEAPPLTAVPRRQAPERPAVYGAPMARHTSGTVRPGLGWQLDAPTGTEVGEIDDHLVSLLEPTSFAAEQYRTVRLAIETLRRERGTRVVAISSPGRGDGKTMTALNVAGALAQGHDARVVLVEADLRHPAVGRALGLPATRGLSSYLLDASVDLDAVIERPPTIAFAVVPAGAVSSMPYELLKAPRLAALLGELRERFDYVLLDTPPALPFPDVGILRDLVDGFVIVVRANRTARETLQDAMSVLGRQRTLGLVFNDDDRTSVPTFEEKTDASWRRLVRPLGARAA